MATWHYDLFLIATAPTSAATLQDRLNTDFPPLLSPSPKLLLWGSLEGDRIDFWTNQSPLQLLARFDLRTPSETFSQSILKLAHDLQLRMVNANDTEIAPTDAALQSDIATSLAAEYVRNPPLDEYEEEDPT